MIRASAAMLTLAAAAWASPALADPEDAPPPTIAVSGVGVVDVAPDRVEITFGVTTNAAAATDALSENTARSEKIAAALRDLGLGKDEVRTNQFSISPVYGRGNDAVIAGYSVSNTVTVRTAKIDAAGKIVKCAVDAGANQFHGLSFTLSEPAGRAEAIDRAVRSARADAEALARAAGVRLGTIRRMTVDGPAPGPRPMFRMATHSAMAPASAPEFAPGDIAVAATVTIEFDILPAK